MTSSEFRTEARKNLAGKWGKAALISLAYFFFFFVLNFIQGLFDDDSILNTIMSIAIFIIEVPLSLGLVIAFVKLYNNTEVKAFDFLTVGFNNFSKSWGIFFQTFLKVLIPVILVIVSVIVLFLGLSGSIFSAAILASGGTSSSAVFYILLIIGLIGYIASIIWATTKSYYYLLAPIIVAEHPELSAKEAVEESEKLMNENRAKLFWLQLSFIGWSILCAFTLGIGYLWLVPYIQFASIAFYKYLSHDSQPIETTTEDSPIKE